MQIVKSALFGGAGGSPFNDFSAPIAKIERIRVRYDQYVHGIAITYLLNDAERLMRTYGGLVGNESPELIFADDERICAVTIRCGHYVDSLSFVTYRMFNLVGMKKYGPYGGPGGQAHSLLSPNIKEIFGRSGELLDSIGFRCEAPLVVC